MHDIIVCHPDRSISVEEKMIYRFIIDISYFFHDTFALYKNGTNFRARIAYGAVTGIFSHTQHATFSKSRIAVIQNHQLQNWSYPVRFGRDRSSDISDWYSEIFCVRLSFRVRSNVRSSRYCAIESDSELVSVSLITDDTFVASPVCSLYVPPPSPKFICFPDLVVVLEWLCTDWVTAITILVVSYMW